MYLMKYQNIIATIVFFISAKKINKLKALIIKYFSQREIVICREMTKLF